MPICFFESKNVVWIRKRGIFRGSRAHDNRAIFLDPTPLIVWPPVHSTYSCIIVILPLNSVKCSLEDGMQSSQRQWYYQGFWEFSLMFLVAEPTNVLGHHKNRKKKKMVDVFIQQVSWFCTVTFSQETAWLWNNLQYLISTWNFTALDFMTSGDNFVLIGSLILTLETYVMVWVTWKNLKSCTGKLFFICQRDVFMNLVVGGWVEGTWCEWQEAPFYTLSLAVFHVSYYVVGWETESTPRVCGSNRGPLAK